MQRLLCLLLTFCFSCTLTASPFEEKLSASIHPVDNSANKIGRIVINDQKNGINDATWIYVNAALTEYKKSKPICIILELNTPGGEVFAAQRISNALKAIDTQYGIPVIAYINNWAISAGAMLAYSSRYIVIAKDASMGAAEPVTFGEAGKMESAPEKVNSALRSEFVNCAEFFGRNGAIAEAMVDKDVILVKRDGKIIKLNSEDQIIKEGQAPDILISPKGKLLTLNAAQLMEYGVADYKLEPVKLEPLTLEQEKTGSYPLAQSPISQIPFFGSLTDVSIDTFQMNWQTKFVAFLSLPAITSLLFTGMIICFYLEMNTPGFGVAGVFGILCLFFIGLSSFAMEAIHWLEPLLLLFGLFLIALELFFFPTLGILGLFGALFAFVGIAGIMLPGLESVSFDGSTINIAGEYVLSRLGWLSFGFIVAVVAIALLSRYVTPRFRLLQKIVLNDIPVSEEAKEIRKPLHVGDQATVSMTLRPAGKIILAGSEYDAISSGSFIEQGKIVQVVAIEGEKIVVEEKNL